ncbi:hypothetical protein KPL74_06000 [Bacillus sp. NP157]|nr:hypothetical protein KPL74_06000 [Bacillus sp. NP157]
MPYGFERGHGRDSLGNDRYRLRVGAAALAMVVAGCATVDLVCVGVVGLTMAADASANNESTQENLRPVQVSICDLAPHMNAYEGARVRLAGTYESDGAHWEFISDAKCPGGGRLISIGRHGEQPSVKAFYAAKERRCQATHQQFLCISKFPIDVVGVVRLLNGEYVFDPVEIIDAKLPKDAGRKVVDG